MLIKLVTVKKKLSGSITSKNVKSLLFICGFRLNSKQDLQKYGQIILDFSYFNNSIEVEKKIETNPVINIELLLLKFEKYLYIFFNILGLKGFK